ncbi:thioredoxin family protein [bacterium]|nr:thioredoxin family protein [bacterium]
MKHLHVVIYGPMCATCNLLYKRSIDVLEDLGYPYEIEKIEDPAIILAQGFLLTPVLVVNQKVIAQGEIPFFDSLKKEIMLMIAEAEKKEPTSLQ